jgi:hypothetical protein
MSFNPQLIKQFIDKPSTQSLERLLRGHANSERSALDKALIFQSLPDNINHLHERDTHKHIAKELTNIFARLDSLAEQRKSIYGGTHSGLELQMYGAVSNTIRPAILTQMELEMNLNYFGITPWQPYGITFDAASLVSTVTPNYWYISSATTFGGTYDITRNVTATPTVAADSTLGHTTLYDHSDPIDSANEIEVKLPSAMRAFSDQTKALEVVLSAVSSNAATDNTNEALLVLMSDGLSKLDLVPSASSFTLPVREHSYRNGTYTWFESGLGVHTTHEWGPADTYYSRNVGAPSLFDGKTYRWKISKYEVLAYAGQEVSGSLGMSYPIPSVYYDDDEQIRINDIVVGDRVAAGNWTQTSETVSGMSATIF